MRHKFLVGIMAVTMVGASLSGCAGSSGKQSNEEKTVYVSLTNKDVVRHPLVQKIVKAYEEYDEKMAKKKQQREKK